MKKLFIPALLLALIAALSACGRDGVPRGEEHRTQVRVLDYTNTPADGPDVSSLLVEPLDAAPDEDERFIVLTTGAEVPEFPEPGDIIELISYGDTVVLTTYPPQLSPARIEIVRKASASDSAASPGP